ncbi:class I SAM-dependent methyltransferase [Gimesia sp.]|uniref:class I SAM-dependent methyltransferase n=1 Tax=Gimesia sp. TaxID=2024833 RepID=UPI003A94D9B3
MSLVEIEISKNDSFMPDEIVAFLREADERVSQFLQASPRRATGFVPSDFKTIYHALQAITDENLAPGNSLCEWGSGFGVVTSLASMLEFMACGIEIEEELVEASRLLADDFGLPVEFVQGSFIPSGAESCVDEAYAENNAEYSWLITDADDGYEELQLDPEDFDVVFAYPWPGEEYLITSLFEKYAARGALLLTYNSLESVRLRRKL